MIRSLYTSGWSLMSQNRALDVSSNNMANANTTGYKKDTVVYESFPDVLTARINDTNTSSSPTGKVGKMQYGNKIGEIYTYYSQGQVVSTGNKFDLCLDNSENSFFTVGITDDNGDMTEHYTRDGSFTVNPDNYLITREGNPVLSEEGPILVDGGDFSVDDSGNIIQDGETIGKLKIATFTDTGTLNKFHSNMVSKSEESEFEDFKGSVTQGALESSNVNSVREMVTMITIMRSYETSQKIVQMVDGTLERSVNEVGQSR